MACSAEKHVPTTTGPFSLPRSMPFCPMKASKNSIANSAVATGLSRYDAACKAVADAKSVDEVKSIRDQAVAIQLYARMARDKSLEADAAEIRERAEYRLGEMLAVQRRPVCSIRARD